MAGCVLESGLRAKEILEIQKADKAFVDLDTSYDGSVLTFVHSFGRKYDPEDQRRRMKMDCQCGGKARW